MITASTDLMWRYLIDRNGMSPSAMLVLNRLHRQGPMRLTALAEAEDASQSGMTQLVQRMEHQGLLERYSDPDDGRASLVTVGEAGRKLWEERAAIREQRIADLLAGLTQEDQMALWLAAKVAGRLLNQMRDMADTPAGADSEGAA